MRIHWESGQQTYNSAEEAERELHRRGLLPGGHLGVDNASGTGTSATRRLDQTLSWQRVHRRGERETTKRARTGYRNSNARPILELRKQRRGGPKEIGTNYDPKCCVFSCIWTLSVNEVNTSVLSSFFV